MAHMNCVGVTCLTMVMPSGNFCSVSPYLAEMSFQVPTSLFSALATLFGFSATAFVAATANETTTARHTIRVIDMTILHYLDTTVSTDGDVPSNAQVWPQLTCLLSLVRFPAPPAP